MQAHLQDMLRQKCAELGNVDMWKQPLQAQRTAGVEELPDSPLFEQSSKQLSSHLYLHAPQRDGHALALHGGHAVLRHVSPVSLEHKA